MAVVVSRSSSISRGVKLKQLLVFGDKTFKIGIPDDAKITFAPWSPPRSNDRGFQEQRNTTGTLRIYQGTKENIIACFSGVHGFRDLSLEYAEEVAREEGAVIWKDDEKGYVRESKVEQTRDWIQPELPAATPRRKRR